jgi:hypothetical protein
LRSFQNGIDVRNMSENAPGVQKKQRAGGAANAAGMNFQAAATAYVCVCMLEEEPVAWLEKLCAEPPVPVAVIPESGGPGDDIRIDFKGGFTAEVQVKKGLTANVRLWKTLDALAKAVHEGTLAYGVLIVDPQSSRAIRIKLAQDIIDVGKGADVSTKGHIATWQRRLESKGIPIEAVCPRIRIKIFHGTEVDSGDVEGARKALNRLMVSGNTSQGAWPTLIDEVMGEMASSGRINSDSLAKMFTRHGFALNPKTCSAALHSHYRDWVKDHNSDFAWPGARKGLPLHRKLPLQVCRYEHSRHRNESVQSALTRYRAGAEAKRYADKFDIDWLARFKKRAVIVAGPGLGKTMALRVLAHRYSVDGYFVLFVRLKHVVKVMSEGKTFKFALIETAVGNSGLSREEFLSIDPALWVLLADGLDECGAQRGSVAFQLRTFVSGRPGMRAVLTTRPMGYETHELEAWAHYEIIPPAKEEGADNLAKLMIAGADGDRTPEECERIARTQLRKSPASDAISTSPLLLGMAACLLLQYPELPENRTELYVQFLRLYDKFPSELNVESEISALTVLNALGWFLRKKPAEERSELESRCAHELVLEGYSLSDAKKQVRIALEHWKKLGLIEELSHQLTELLTFTHLSFAEFLAARYLLEQHPRLLGEVAYDSQWQEVLGYAVELGMSPSLVDVLLEQHEKGEPEALYYALFWSSKFEAAASEASLERLIGTAIEVLDSSTSLSDPLHFKVGHGLCEIAPKTSRLLDAWVSRHLESPQPSLRLIAWSIASRCAIALPEVLRPRPIFLELLAIYGKPLDMHDIFSKRVRHEALLLQHVALMVLKSCSQDEIEAFSDSLSADERLQKTLEFRFQILKIRNDHGIREKNSGLAKPLRNLFPRPVPDPEALGRFRDRQRRVSRLLANAFCNGALHKPLDAFPELAAFILAIQLDPYNLREEFGDHEPEDLVSFGSTCRDFALLFGLDLPELAAEAWEVLRRLETEPQFSLFDFLPLVDIENNVVADSPRLQVNLEHAKLNLLRGSRKIQIMATVLLVQATLTDQEVCELLYNASDSALACVCLVVEAQCPDRATELFVRYLQDVDCQQAEHILQSLVQLQAPAIDGLEALAIGYLTHANIEVVVSAIDLIKGWVEDEGFSRTLAIEHALQYWKDRPSISDESDRDVCSELNWLQDAMAGVG